MISATLSFFSSLVLDHHIFLLFMVHLTNFWMVKTKTDKILSKF